MKLYSINIDCQITVSNYIISSLELLLQVHCTLYIVHSLFCVLVFNDPCKQSYLPIYMTFKRPISCDVDYWVTGTVETHT